MLRRYYGKISKLPIDQFTGHDGELVVDDLTGRTYVMDGITLGGHELVGATPRYETSPPISPVPGALWYDPTSGRLFIYYDSQWVDAAPNTTYTLPEASNTVLGGVKVDNETIVINEYGVISAIGDGYLSNRLVNGDKTISLDTNGILNFPNNNGQIGQLEAPYTGLEFRTGSGADWIGLSYGEINDNNTSYFYFDKDGPNYTTANHLAHLQLKNPAHDGHVEWLFDSSGNLTLPNGSKIGNNFERDGITMTTSRGTVLFGNQPEGPTLNQHFHIMKENPTEVDLFFGDDNNYLKLPRDGNVSIRAGGPVWDFNGNDASLILPDQGVIKSASGNVSIIGNISSSSFHAQPGIVNGAGFLFKDEATGGYISGMRHSNLSNELQLVHQGNAGMRMSANGEVIFGNIKIQGNVNSFLLVNNSMSARGITSNSYNSYAGSTFGYRFNNTPGGNLPTALVHDNTSNQVRLIHEGGHVGLYPNGSFQTSNIIIQGNDLSVSDGKLYVNGLPVTGIGNISSSNFPPTTPVSGQLWYDTDNGKIYVYLIDSWVDASPTFSSYSDIDVAAYLPTNSTIVSLRNNASYQATALKSLQSNINVLVSNASTQSIYLNLLFANAATQSTDISRLNSNAVTQAIAINTLTSNLATLNANVFTHTPAINTLISNVAALISNANVQAIAINTLTSNVATLNANAITQAVAINTLTAKINAANVHIASMSAYSNANVDAYLATYIGTVGGSITVGDILRAPPHTKTATATGSVGQICWDSNYIYVCTATNTWKRVALIGGY